MNVPGAAARVDRLMRERGSSIAPIHALVGARMAEVERLYREHLASPVAIVDQLGSYIAEGQGKRLRPMLHLLTASMVGYRGPHDTLLGVVLEYIHSATLVHDDVIDEAATRRGRASVNARWGNNLTVLFGDYLFAKAMDLALRADSLEIMRQLADVTLRMTEGEMLQTRFVGRLDVSVPEYLDMVERKTAALFACCCQTAGILAGIDPNHRRALSGYGRNLGMAFQLIDDLLDFTGDERRLGKPSGSDLREGKATLAVLDAVAAGDGEVRRLATAVMDAAAIDDGPLVALRERLLASGAFARVQTLAQRYAQDAVRALDGFDGGPAATALRTLPEILVYRDQ